MGPGPHEAAPDRAPAPAGKAQLFGSGAQRRPTQHGRWARGVAGVEGRLPRSYFLAVKGLLVPGQGGYFAESSLESEEEVASCHQRTEQGDTMWLADPAWAGTGDLDPSPASTLTH